MNAAQRSNVTNVDQTRRRVGAVLHAVKKIDTAGFHDCAIFELRERGLDGGAIGKSEGIHRDSIDGWGWLRAASTTAGVMGNWRMRTPVAL